jgi:ribosomal protein L17
MSSPCAQPYFQLLEQTMEKLVTWAKPPKVSKTAASAAQMKSGKSLSSGFEKLKKSKQSGGFGK